MQRRSSSDIVHLENLFTQMKVKWPLNIDFKSQGNLRYHTFQPLEKDRMQKPVCVVVRFGRVLPS